MFEIVVSIIYDFIDVCPFWICISLVFCFMNRAFFNGK